MEMISMEQLMVGMPQSKFERWVSPVPITTPGQNQTTSPQPSSGR